MKNKQTMKNLINKKRKTASYIKEAKTALARIDEAIELKKRALTENYTDDDFDADELEGETEAEIAEFIVLALDEADSNMGGSVHGRRFKDIRSFDEAGVMSNNTGIVLSMSSGKKFQVTIVESSSSY